MIRAADSAFPYPPAGDVGVDVRTWMATHVLAGLATRCDLESGSRQAAARAVRLADALLRQLNAPDLAPGALPAVAEDDGDG